MPPMAMTADSPANIHPAMTKEKIAICSDIFARARLSEFLLAMTTSYS